MDKKGRATPKMRKNGGKVVKANIVLSKKDKDLKIDIKNIKKTKIVYDKFKEVIKS